MAIGTLIRAASLSVGLLVAVVVPCAAARGERSYSLPEIDAAVAAAVPIVRSAVWEHDADAPTNDRNITAIGAGTIAFARHGQLCGYAEVDGAQAWCIQGGTAPVFAVGPSRFHFSRRSDR